MTDNPEAVPRTMRVPCFNALDGCKNSVSYMGVAPVRKLCPSCMDSDAPSERTVCGTSGFNFDDERRKPLARPKIPMNYSGGEAVYEITVRPKTINGGRVAVYFHD